MPVSGVCYQQVEGECGLFKPKERPDVSNNSLNAKVYSYIVYRFRALNMLIISFQKIPLLICKDLTNTSNAHFGIRTSIFYASIFYAIFFLSCLFIRLQIRYVALHSPK